MSLPFFWEGGLGIGYLRRDGKDGWAPSAVLGALAPPVYLFHGFSRNEIGAHVRGYLATGGSVEADGYVAPFFRSSLELATMIVRLQAGPTFDFRTGRVGLIAAVGLEFAWSRWITGGGALTDF